MPKYKFQREETTGKEEVNKLIKVTTLEWLQALISLLYLFGCRITEATQLKGSDVWIENHDLCAKIGVLKRREKAKGPYGNLPHILRVQLSKENEVFWNLIHSYVEKNKESQRLFPYTRQLVWLRLKEINKMISPHVFRHDRLMKLALKGASESVLQDWAGWTDTRPASAYIRATGRLAAQYKDKVE